MGLMVRIYIRPDPDEAMIKAEVIKRATKSYILVDSSKFNIKSLIKFASRSEVEIITSS